LGVTVSPSQDETALHQQVGIGPERFVLIEDFTLKA
jgi:hypothetical protein